MYKVDIVYSNIGLKVFKESPATEMLPPVGFDVAISGFSVFNIISYALLILI